MLPKVWSIKSSSDSCVIHCTNLSYCVHNSRYILRLPDIKCNVSLYHAWLNC